MKYIATHSLHFILLLACLYLSELSGQVMKFKNQTYGVDHTNKLIIIHSDTEALDVFQRTINHSIFLDKQYAISSSIKKFDFNTGYRITNQEKTYTLYFTKLPIIQICFDLTINENTKIAASFKYGDHTSFENLIGIELRGNLSLTYPKKSYDIEFWSDSISKKSIDVGFKKLRNDDDWILDGIYNEPLRIRSYLSQKLWLDMHTPHYKRLQKKARSGIDAIYVEVFINEKYHGIHTLTEQVDRKLLQLKEHQNGSVQGELFKASSYQGGPSFENAPEFKNIFPHWAGYEMEYPVINYTSHWDNLHETTKFVVSASSDDFKKGVFEKFNRKNAIDYYLFVNLLRATDNLGKNFYIARYKANMPYFFVPWDLDGVMGIIQDGKRISTTNDILTNGLFERLLLENPKNYKSKLKKRWIKLRKKQFSNKTLFSSIDSLYYSFQSQKIYEREQKIWPDSISKKQHYNYLKTWLNKRLLFLDNYYENID